MSYSCAENVAQLSRVQRWFKHSTGVQEKKKKKKLTHEGCKGAEIAEQANKTARMQCGLSLQEWQTMIKPDSNHRG